MIAAYADPCVVFCLMMIPALDHGCTPEVHPAVPVVVLKPAAGYSPVRDVSRTVSEPFPVSGWCTKKNASWTASPFGPIAGPGQAVVTVRPFGPEVWEAHELRPRNANPAGSTAARSRPISQPRMVRSFVHSARTVWPKRSRLSATSD